MPTEKKPEYSPGLAGVIAGETAICWVDPNAGLMYRGYDIHEMAQKASFEEVAYLLLNGELPNGKQLVEFTRQIAAERALPGPVIEMLRLLPKETHPMDMLRTGVSMLGAFDKDLNDHSHDANIRKSIRLIARVSTLITDGWRILHGEDPLPEKPDLTQAGNFFYKLNGQSSAGSGKFGCWTRFSSLRRPRIQCVHVCGARNGFDAGGHVRGGYLGRARRLKGPLHGGANEESMKMLDEIGTPDRAEAWLMEELANEGEDHGLRPSRLQKRRFTGADHARDRARSGQAHRQGTMGADLRKARGSDGARKTTLRQCRSLCGAGVYDARLSSRN